ncbi:glucodextranase DOMON-like domain-containing protein [Caldiplasma sukawensis]
MLKKLAFSLAFIMILSAASISGSLGTSITHNHTIIEKNVNFTGNPYIDFGNNALIYDNTNESAWGAQNNICSFYSAYNETCLFLGFYAHYVNNGFIVFINNGTGSTLGTYNFTNMNVWTRNIIFTSPVNVFFANYACGPSQLYSIKTPLNMSDRAPQGQSENVKTYYGTNSVEIAIPLSEIFQNHTGLENIKLAAFIVGGSGSWVGTGIPFNQIGTYNDGNQENYFTVNNFLNLSLKYNGPSPAKTNPINLDIIYNDHQPLYTSVGSSYWLLPWTDVHLEEYAEQAIILGEYPEVNVTYSLSGSLLYQIDAIMNGNYNNSYIMAALIPQSQWNNTVYREIKEYGDSFLESFVGRYAWNTTTVRYVLENDLAFNTPSWVYSSGTPAGNLYAKLFSYYSKGIQLNNSELKDALVEFFLWSVSYPIISGQLGKQYENTTLLPLYYTTNFSINDIFTIIKYYPVEARIVITQFALDHNKLNNVELMTTPFDHPILPLLLTSSWTDQNGNEVYKGTFNTDVQAQLNIGRTIFFRNFGFYPSGQWTPEQAVSNAIIPYLYSAGVKWTSTDQAVLGEAGVLSSSNSNLANMESLYESYLVNENGSKVYIVFRDSTLSNDWAFNYGGLAQSQGTWAAVDQFIAYLKNVYNTIPASRHYNTLVTVAIDGENWMFESPFPEDAVPFLMDLYKALQQNSSFIRTVTPQEYIFEENHSHGNLSYLPTGSWNYQGPAGSVSPYLTQWAGHPTQDQAWIWLGKVRSEVLKYGEEKNLIQPKNLSYIDEAGDYPFIGEWNVTTLQERYDEAWFSIYAAEGSDIYFSFDPGDQNLYAQNDIVFEHELRRDLRNALSVLGLSIPTYLSYNWTVPQQPYQNLTSGPVTPPMDGSYLNFGESSFGTYISVSNNSMWNGSALFNFKVNGQKFYVRYEFNSSGIFLLAGDYSHIMLNGMEVYFSNPNIGEGDLVGLSYPGASFSTVDGEPLHYSSTIYFKGNNSLANGIPLQEFISFNGSFINNGYSGIYSGTGISEEMYIPFSAIGYSVGNNFEFTIVLQIKQRSEMFGPLEGKIPLNINSFNLIASVRNNEPSNGPGYYTYPENSYDYPANSVKMVYFNVSENSEYAEFSVKFGNLSNPFGGPYGFSQPIIDIYIHRPGENGSIGMLAGPNADVTENFAWELAIQADGFPENAYIITNTGQLENNGYYILSNLSTSTVNIFVPLSVTGTNLLDYGYVVVSGFQDGYGINGWDPVYQSATEYQGGGSTGPNSPNIFSYIAPYDVNGNSSQTQQIFLSNYSSTHLASLPGIYLNGSARERALRVNDIRFDTLIEFGGLVNVFYYTDGWIYRSMSSNGIVWVKEKLMKFNDTISSLSPFTFKNGIKLLITSGETAYIYSVNQGIVEKQRTFHQNITSASILKFGDAKSIVLAFNGSINFYNIEFKKMFTLDINAEYITISELGLIVDLSFINSTGAYSYYYFEFPIFHRLILYPFYEIKDFSDIPYSNVTGISSYKGSIVSGIYAIDINDNGTNEIYLINSFDSRSEKLNDAGTDLSFAEIYGNGFLPEYLVFISYNSAFSVNIIHFSFFFNHHLNIFQTLF